MRLGQYVRPLGLAMLLICLIGCAAAPTPTPAPAPTDTPAAAEASAAVVAAACCVGERCEAGGVALLVRDFTTETEIEDAVTPQAGNALLAVDVTLEVVGEEPVTYDSSVFRVRAPDGTIFPASTIVPDAEGRPGPGETALLRVVFEVPEGTVNMALLYNPPELNGQEIEVSLGCAAPA